MTSGFRSLLLAGLIAAACCSGYVAGCTKAAAEGKAALNALMLKQAVEKRQSAEAYANVLAATQEKYRQEVARGDALAESLAAQDKAHAAETGNLRRQVANATKDSTITLSPAVVRLLNQAAGASGAAIPDDALPGTLCAAGLNGKAGAGAGAATGILGRGGVSEADLAAWFLIYAQRTHWLEQRLAGWQRQHSERLQQNAARSEQ